MHQHEDTRHLNSSIRISGHSRSLEALLRILKPYGNWQGLKDSPFKSYEHTDSKNIIDKSQQPCGGVVERFEIWYGNSILKLP